MSHPTLVAVRLTRKAASVAIFNRTHLEYARLRHLPTSTAKARQALQAFLSWATAQFNVEMFAVEKSDRIDAARVQELTRAVEEHASRAAIPVWHAGKMQVIESYAEPAPKTRTELRTIAAGIWPMLATRDNNPLDLEAAALGLYVQVERLLSTPQ